METTMAKISPLWFILLSMASFFVSHAFGGNLPLRIISSVTHHETLLGMKAFKASLTKHDSIASFSPSPSPSPMLPQVIQSYIYIPSSSLHLC